MNTISIKGVLGVQPGDVVALIGAGGKTTLMYRLAAELVSTCPVLVTTTTRILHPGNASNHRVVVTRHRQQACREVRKTIGQGRTAVLGAGLVEGQKLAGIPADWWPDLLAEMAGGVVLVEADGAARKPLKGHAAHEPVVPHWATLVVMVAGMRVLGRSLGPEWVHRPEIVARISGIPLGQPITVQAAARVVAHGLGLAARQAPNARLVVWLNQVEGLETGTGLTPTEGNLPGARIVARHLAATGKSGRLASLPSTVQATGPVQADAHQPVNQMILPVPFIERKPCTEGEACGVLTTLAGTGFRVILGQAAGEPPVVEQWPAPWGVAGVVLAAGCSTRLGGEKMLLPLAGKPLVCHAVDNLLGAGVDPVVVVVGHRGDEVKQVLGDRPVRVVDNSRYREGQGTSLVAGLGALLEGEWAGRKATHPKGGLSAAVFALADQPLIPPGVVDALVAAYRTNRCPVVYPTYLGRRGNPVLFDHTLFHELLQLQGDTGGREVLLRYQEQALEVPVEAPGILVDVDTSQDYQRLLGS